MVTIDTRAVGRRNHPLGRGCTAAPCGIRHTARTNTHTRRMMANARSEQLAFAKGEYAKKHPHTAAPKKKPSLDQFLNQQMNFRASYEAWAGSRRTGRQARMC